MSLQARRVVEQSRQTPPPWIAHGALNWHFDQTAFELVSTKERILDITLGLDQAYVSAVSEMRLKLHDFLVKYWTERGAYAALTAEDRTLFERQLLQTLESRIDGSVVQDIYFEKIFVPGSDDSLRDTYTVYVQLRVESPQMALLLSEVKEKLATSPRQSWNQFAQMTEAFPIEKLKQQTPQSDLVDSPDTDKSLE